MFHIPEGAFPVQGTVGCVTANGGVTLDNISMKNAQMVYMVFHITSGTGHAIAYTPLVGTVVATCATALPNTVEIWYGDVSTTVTTLTKQTDAKLHTTAATAGLTSYLIFVIDPASCGDYDCLGGTVADATHADYLISCTYWIVPRYAEKTASRDTNEFIVD
jgi:hypothetical protein